MTKEELKKQYCIPAEILNKYEKYRKCDSFGETDAENISMLMTLYAAGFDDTEAKKYMELCFSGYDTSSERTKMLEKKRKDTLFDIHVKQKQLDGIDYLRYKISRENKL